MTNDAVFPESPAAASAPAPESSAPTATARLHTVRKDDLLRTVAPVGGDYRFSRPHLGAEEAVLHGDFETLSLRPGLVLHRTRVRDLHDMQTRLTVQPGLKIGLLVQGQTEVAFGPLDLRLGPQRDAQGRVHNRGSIVALTEPETFSRRWRRGRSEAKVSVTLTAQWLDAGGVADSPALARVQEFRARHLAHHVWEPSARAQALAQQIAHPPALATPFRQWYLEARAIEFALEALHALADVPAPSPVPLSAREHRRLRDLQAWLDAQIGPAGQALTLADIARQAAMSPGALQRAFRAYSGQTLFDYLRARRLDAARQALERDGVNVAQAAEIAGYTSANNFATAFKRRFGCTPRHTRLRV